MFSLLKNERLKKVVSPEQRFRMTNAGRARRRLCYRTRLFCEFTVARLRQASGREMSIC